MNFKVIKLLSIVVYVLIITLIFKNVTGAEENFANFEKKFPNFLNSPFFSSRFNYFSIMDYLVSQKSGENFPVFSEVNSFGTKISATSEVSGLDLEAELIHNLLSEVEIKLGLFSFYPRNYLFSGNGKIVETKTTIEFKNFFPIKVEATTGPSYEIKNLTNRIVSKPGKSLGLFATFGEFDIFGRYQIHHFSPEGSQFNRLKAGVNYKILENFNIEVAGEVLPKSLNFFNENLLNNFRWYLQTVIEPISRFELISVLSGHRLKKEDVFLGAKVKLKNYFNTGTDFSLEGYQSGYSYFEQYKMLPTESIFEGFDYLFNSGKTAFGAGFKQEVFNQALSLLGRVNVNFGQNVKKTSWEFGVAYDVSEDIQIEAGYKSYYNFSERKRELDYLAAGVNLEF